MKSRFSDSQILTVLKQAEDGTPVPERCREYGISSATFYDRRKSQSHGTSASHRTLTSNATTEPSVMAGSDLFDSVDEVQEPATGWLWTYNREFPDTALDGITPMQKLALVT